MKRSLWIPILASCALHGIAYLFFGWTWAPTASGPAGVVSVDFVEAVVHAPTETARETSKPKLSHSPKHRTNKVEAVDRPESADHGVVEKPTVASAESVARGNGSREAQVFQSEVTRLINERKTYPRAALVRELEGRVVVAITLDRNGSLIATGVEEPCSYEVLNQAALAAVRLVSRFPPLPPSLDGPLHLHVPIAFKISRR